jgi:hypothetical protein
LPSYSGRENFKRLVQHIQTFISPLVLTIIDTPVFNSSSLLPDEQTSHTLQSIRGPTIFILVHKEHDSTDWNWSGIFHCTPILVFPEPSAMQPGRPKTNAAKHQIFAVQTTAKKNQEDTRPVEKALMKVAERLGARNGFGRLMRRAKVHGLPVPTLSANSRLCAFVSISVMVNVAALFLATRSAGHVKKMFADFGVAIQAMLLASATDSVVNGDGFMAWKREVNVSHVVWDWTKAFLSVRDGGSKQTEAMKF